LDPELESRYLDALRADLEASLPLVWGRNVQTIFIGGGTPSLFSPEAIDPPAGRRARPPAAAARREITLEANPGTFERERFRAFRAAGVTGCRSACRASTTPCCRARPGARRAQAIAALRRRARPSTPSTST
jgi:hypothetical protein